MNKKKALKLMEAGEIVYFETLAHKIEKGEMYYKGALEDYSPKQWIRTEWGMFNDTYVGTATTSWKVMEKRLSK